MDIIRLGLLTEFAKKHPNTRSSLTRWCSLIQERDFGSFEELRAVFPHVDQVGNLTVFNIAGNNARLITYVYYDQQRIYVRDILTHADYNRGRWKE